MAQPESRTFEMVFQRLANKEDKRSKKASQRLAVREAHALNDCRSSTQEDPLYDPCDWERELPTMGDRLVQQQRNLLLWLRDLAAAAAAKDEGMVRWVWRSKSQYVLDTPDEEMLSYFLSYSAKVFIGRALRRASVLAQEPKQGELAL
jgi:hypothetical protein